MKYGILVCFKYGLRDNISVTYNTALPVIFGVKKYADALWEVCKERDINVNLRRSLTKVDAGRNVATFENLDKPGEKIEEEVVYFIYNLKLSKYF